MYIRYSILVLINYNSLSMILPHSCCGMDERVSYGLVKLVYGLVLTWIDILFELWFDMLDNYSLWIIVELVN